MVLVVVIVPVKPMALHGWPWKGPIRQKGKVPQFNIKHSTGVVLEGP